MNVPLRLWHAVGRLKISVCIFLTSAVHISVYQCMYSFLLGEDDDAEESDCCRGVDDVFEDEAEDEALDRGEYIVSRENS